MTYVNIIFLYGVYHNAYIAQECLNVQRQTDGVFIRPLAALALVRQVIVLQLLQIRNADGAGFVIGCGGLWLLRLWWLLELWWRWLHLDGFGLQAR